MATGSRAAVRIWLPRVTIACGGAGAGFPCCAEEGLENGINEFPTTMPEGWSFIVTPAIVAAGPFGASVNPFRITG